jgi:hypothetical protein
MSDAPLSKQQIESFRHSLQMLSPSHVREQYITAHANCCLARGELPKPAEIQRMLCIWKILWEWKQRERR